MSKKVKNSKLSKSVSQQSFAPALRAALKKKPRGKPFPKNNPIGLATRFVKGVCPNPGGRPRTARLHEAIRNALAMDSSERLPMDSNAEVIAMRIVNQAKRGSLAAAVVAGDRAEGRPSVTIIDERPDGLAQLIAGMNAAYEAGGPPETSEHVRQLDLTDGFSGGGDGDSGTEGTEHSEAGEVEANA